MGLFSKKPGGTFFGNLLRAGSAKVSGGILGSGANRIELGQTKTNAQLAAEVGQPNTQFAQIGSIALDSAMATPQGQAFSWSVVKEWSKEHWMQLCLVATFIGGVVYMTFFNKKRFGAKRRF